MRIFLFLGFICIVAVFGADDKKQISICYKAKTCIHNAKEKCGVDEEGGYRRFFDSCDMMEYNCLRSKNFSRVSRTKCESLPPLEEKKKHKRSKEDKSKK